MKLVVLVFVLALTQGRLLHGISFNIENPEPEVPAKLVIKGFLAGMALDSSIEELLPCIKDVEKVVEELGKIGLEFKTINPIKIMKGLKDTEKLLAELPGVIAECASDLKSDYLRAKSSLQALKLPRVVNYEDGIKFEMNGVDITNDIKQIYASTITNRYYEIGFYFGSIMAKVCGTGILDN